MGAEQLAIAKANRADMRAWGISYEYLENDPDAVIEHLGRRIFEKLAAWLIPSGGDK